MVDLSNSDARSVNEYKADSRRLGWRPLLEAVVLVAVWILVDAPHSDLLSKPFRWSSAGSHIPLLFVCGVTGFYAAAAMGVRAAPLMEAMFDRECLLKAMTRVAVAAGVVAVAGWVTVTQIVHAATGSFGFLPELPLNLPVIRAFAVVYSGAAIVEEVEFRLFLLSMLALAIARILPAKPRGTDLVSLWIGNVLQALVFGGVHIWQGETTLAPWAPSWLQVLVAVQTWSGLVLGFVFARYGIEASILTHCLYDMLMSFSPKSLFS